MVRSYSFPGDGSKTGPSSRKMTTEERAVLAWERIADELTLLNQSFEHFLDRDGGAPLERQDGGPTDHELHDDDFGAAPASDQQSAAIYEAGHSMANSFSVAGHHYPNLQRAFKQPSRAPFGATDESGDD